MEASLPETRNDKKVSLLHDNNIYWWMQQMKSRQYWSCAYPHHVPTHQRSRWEEKLSSVDLCSRCEQHVPTTLVALQYKSEQMQCSVWHKPTLFWIQRRLKSNDRHAVLLVPWPRAWSGLVVRMLQKALRHGTSHSLGGSAFLLSVSSRLSSVSAETTASAESMYVCVCILVKYSSRVEWSFYMLASNFFALLPVLI